jgi:hypothetical protein
VGIVVVFVLACVLIIWLWPAEWKGVVVDAKTGEPISNALVWLQYKHGNIGPVDSTESIDYEDFMTTDGNGIFHVKEPFLFRFPILSWTKPINITVWATEYRMEWPERKRGMSHDQNIKLLKISDSAEDWDWTFFKASHHLVDIATSEYLDLTYKERQDIIEMIIEEYEKAIERHPNSKKVKPWQMLINGAEESIEPLLTDFKDERRR